VPHKCSADGQAHVTRACIAPHLPGRKLVPTQHLQQLRARLVELLAADKESDPLTIDVLVHSIIRERIPLRRLYVVGIEGGAGERHKPRVLERSMVDFIGEGEGDSVNEHGCKVCAVGSARHVEALQVSLAVALCRGPRVSLEDTERALLVVMYLQVVCGVGWAEDDNEVLIATKPHVLVVQGVRIVTVDHQDVPV
jgi:hypothetical protein